MALIPYVIESTPGGGERSYDIYSRLLKDRIIVLGTDFNDAMASSIVSQLLFLDSQGQEEISMYINSPGGQVTSGLAIYDTMQYIKSPVRTITMGLAASMGSFIATAGEAGRRFMLPNAEYMVHQPSGGAQGTETDIQIRAAHIAKLRDKLELIYEKHNAKGRTAQEIHDFMQKGDQWLTAEEAIEWGFIDEIVTKA